MKALLKCMFALFVFTLIFVGCQNKQTLTGPKVDNQNTELTLRFGDQSREYPFYTEKNVKIGTIQVINDKNDLYLTYSLDEKWNLVKTYVHLAVDLNGIPLSMNGIPDSSRFDYMTKHHPGLTNYTYKIPLKSFSSLVGKEITIVACAIVQKQNPNTTEIPKIVSVSNKTTAWGGDNQGESRVWHYILYGISGSGVQFKTQQAMVRVNDNPVDLTYHWTNQSWYTYVVVKPALIQQTFYFYSDKLRVGQVEIWRDRAYYYTKVSLDKPYDMTESHLNIQLSEFFGRPNFDLFPYSTVHNLHKNAYTYKIPWSKMWDNKKLYIALEGEVGPF
jgi:hypothetical protein